MKKYQTVQTQSDINLFGWGRPSHLVLGIFVVDAPDTCKQYRALNLLPWLTLHCFDPVKRRPQDGQ